MPLAESPAGYEDALVVCDPHFGLLGRNAALTVEQKLAAFQAILRYGTRHGVRRLLLAGDTRDNRPRRRVVEYEAHQARERLRDCRYPRLLLKGNHDWDLTQEEAESLLGECEVLDGLARVDAPSGVCVGHGHGYGLRRVRTLLREGRGLPPAELLETLHRDPQLRRELDDADRFTRAVDTLEEYSDAARAVGERLVVGFRECRIALAEALRGSNPADDRKRGRLRAADLLDFAPLLTAAELAAATGCWASVYGHYHTPLATVRHAPGPDGLVREVAVADGGSFIQAGKPVTAVHARYPSLTLLRYDAEEDEMAPWTTATIGGNGAA